MLLKYLDERLAIVIEGLMHLERVTVVVKSSYEWPRAMQAIYKRRQLLDLSISARGSSRTPDVGESALRNLTLDSDVGSCRIDLAAFPALQQLNLSMDDNSSFQSWDNLNFPSGIWKTLKILSLRGFALDPIGLLSRLASSLPSTQSTTENIALQDLSYHIARDEQDATYALEVFKDLSLTSFGFTVPVLLDARYARKIARSFPHLKKLELYAFTKAAAWQWPDPFSSYVNVLSNLEHLEELSINHNELPALSLPASLAAPDLPDPHVQSDLAVLLSPLPENVSPEQDSEVAHVESDGSQVEANDNTISLATSSHTEEQAQAVTFPQQELGANDDQLQPYAPLGLNFCHSTSAEQIKKRRATVARLGEKMPRLARVYFEPCDGEPIKVIRQSRGR